MSANSSWWSTICWIVDKAGIGCWKRHLRPLLNQSYRHVFKIIVLLSLSVVCIRTCRLFDLLPNVRPVTHWSPFMKSLQPGCLTLSWLTWPHEQRALADGLRPGNKATRWRVLPGTLRREFRVTPGYTVPDPERASRPFLSPWVRVASPLTLIHHLSPLLLLMYSLSQLLGTLLCFWGLFRGWELPSGANEA